MYVDAVHSGLIGDLGPERWQTLCVIAAFMNEKGECWPTQEQIASRLNIRREAVSKRIKALAEYTWQGRHLIRTVRKRDEHSKAWQNTRYTILPVSQFAIFDGEIEPLAIERT
jgi:transcription initiation factor IIE alpha subunit